MNYQLTHEQWMRCLCIWREARGSSLQAMTAINWVITNRLNDARNRWPKTVSGVILQPKQFSSFNLLDPNSIHFPVEPAPNVNPNPDWTAFLNCIITVTAPLGADPTNGANGYESVPNNTPKPTWADPSKITVTIGPFRFYKL